MGEALVRGLLAAAWAPVADLVVVERDAVRREHLASTSGGLRVVAEPQEADGIIVAVKPGDVEAACRGAAAAGCRRALSIAAGVPLARLEEWLGSVPIVRAMPNTPALVGEGAAAIAGGSAAHEDDMAWAEGILGAVGTVVRVPEPLLDAVTGLSGSGPAYVFLVAEAMVEAGVRVGLPRETSHLLAVQTILGAGRLLTQGTATPEELRAQVTSPGGTTAAGLQVLEERGLRGAFLDAIEAATARARELGTIA